MQRGLLMILTGGLLVGVLTAQAVAQSNLTPAEERNKAFVLDFWHNVFEARNPDKAKDYMAENYVEHNPNVPPGGVAGFVAFMNNFLRGRGRGNAPAGAPAGAAPASDVLATYVDGDVVTLLRKQMVPEASDNTKTYEAFGFEMFRVQNGKIVEHWDAARKLAAPPAGR